MRLSLFFGCPRCCLLSAFSGPVRKQQLFWRVGRQVYKMYSRLQEIASTQKLQKLMQYVGRNWITGNAWPSSFWSVFMKSVRTNNDTQGWHPGMNRHASGKSQLPLCLLIHLLHREACWETFRPRSSTSGMSSTLVPVVQENC